MTNQIIIDAETVKLLSPACKAELAMHLGLDQPAITEEQSSDVLEAGEFAELGLQAARAFLLGCGSKTTDTIGYIVNAGEAFWMRDMEKSMNVGPGALRGVWTGLTKRTRTITGDEEIALIDWFEKTKDGEHGDWRGRLMPVTREAFRRALAE